MPTPLTHRTGRRISRISALREEDDERADAEAAEDEEEEEEEKEEEEVEGDDAYTAKKIEEEQKEISRAVGAPEENDPLVVAVVPPDVVVDSHGNQQVGKIGRTPGPAWSMKRQKDSLAQLPTYALPKGPLGLAAKGYTIK